MEGLLKGRRRMRRPRRSTSAQPSRLVYFNFYLAARSAPLAGVLAGRGVVALNARKQHNKAGCRRLRPLRIVTGIWIFHVF